MSGGGNQRASGERAAENSMDDFLKSIGLHRKSIAKDGSCLFRAVAEQVLFSQSLHTRVRAECVEFLRKHRDNYEAFIEGDFEEYLHNLQDPKQWVGEVEINSLSLMYKRNFLIFQEPGKPAVDITGKKYKKTVQLCFLNGNHYDSVYPIEQMRSAALCQSILYELLYEKVFGVDHGSLSSCLRTSRHSHVVTDENMAPCASSDDSDPDVTEASRAEKDTTTAALRHGQSWQRGRGRGRHLPERVKRSLYPTLFRNVEYDVWQKSLKAQQKRDYCIAAGMQYSVGDHCQVDVEENGRYCSATIKEVHVDVSQVTVETEKSGELRVPLWRLRSHDDTLKTVSRERKTSNGQVGAWEERRRGRGRGRAGPASSSSSASSAAAPGSVGRTQKQHSWPAQTSEDRGAQRVSRSLSEAESASFGMSEEERRAKEEAEKNIALVELHLRDENSFPALSSNATNKTLDLKQLQRNLKSPTENLPSGEAQKPATPPPAVSAAPPSSSDTPAPPAQDENLSTKTPTPNTAASSTPFKLHSDASRITKPVLPSPTFIAPIAPNPAAALDFHRSSSHPRSSLPHSPSPPALIPPSTEGVPPRVLNAASAAPQMTSSLNTDDVVKSSPESTVTHSSPEPPDEQPVQPPSEGKSVRQKSDQQLQNPLVAQSQTSLTEIQPDVQSVDNYPQHQSQGEISTVLQHQSQTFETQHPLTFLHPSPDPLNQPQMQTDIKSMQSCVQQPTEGFEAQTRAEEAFELTPDPSDSLALEQNQPSPLLPSVEGTQPYQQILSAPLHCHPSLQTVPLQELSQLYQDPLYPGFPRDSNGMIAQVPPYSSRNTGEDLPRDPNILRFFFNLGLKAFSQPMCQPCIYLLPLRQAYNLSSQPSTARFLHDIPHADHQGAYQPQMHHLSPALPQYNPHIQHQSLPTEPSNPSESARYPLNQPTVQTWQQPPPKQQLSPNYPVGFATQTQYQGPSPQVYQGGQTLYSPAMQVYTPPPHHFHSPNASGVPQGASEQGHQINGGPGLNPGPGLLETPPAGFHSADLRCLKTEQSEFRSLRVDPLFEHHRTLPPAPYADGTMTTHIRSSNTTGLPAHYYGTDNFQPKTHNHTKSHQSRPRLNQRTPEDNRFHPDGGQGLIFSNQTFKRGRSRQGQWRGEVGSSYNHYNSNRSRDRGFVE